MTASSAISTDILYRLLHTRSVTNKIKLPKLYVRPFSKTRCFAQPAYIPLKRPEDGAHILKQLRILENVADDPSLQNPLARLERMGTGWFGVIFDFEGVLVSDYMNLHMESWLRLAEEEGKPIPLQMALKRASQMKAEQAISEVLCWGREHGYVRRLALRKEKIFLELIGDATPIEMPGIRNFMDMLSKHNVPMAVCSTEREFVYKALRLIDLKRYVDHVVSADDVSRCMPDPEAYAYAAQAIGRPPMRCVVIGASNHSCEAAHDCGMQSLLVAGQKPIYELSAADLVVKQIDQLSLMNLKSLFVLEEGVEPQPEPEYEESTDPDAYLL